MLHKACHFSITALSRADGRSAVAAAAYCAGRRFWDERAARHRDERPKRDIASVEMIGWGEDSATADPETMWNMVEAAERRSNSRVAREFIIALPHELPLPVLTTLVRGYCLWLRDTWEMPTMAAIHVPYIDGLDDEIMEDLRPDARRRSRRPPPDRGNPLNKHAHVLGATRRWIAETGALGDKIREWDDQKTGPEVIQACRDEWQRRVNRELEKHGVEARVDLRSYEKMAAAGDAPEGLIPQRHQGRRATERSRRLERETGRDTSFAGRRRTYSRTHNEELLADWQLRRAEAREEMREDGTSAAIATTRETQRRAEDVAEKIGEAVGTSIRSGGVASASPASAHAGEPSDMPSSSPAMSTSVPAVDPAAGGAPRHPSKKADCTPIGPTRPPRRSVAPPSPAKASSLPAAAPPATKVAEEASAPNLEVAAPQIDDVRERSAPTAPPAMNVTAPACAVAPSQTPARPTAAAPRAPEPSEPAPLLGVAADDGQAVAYAAAVHALRPGDAVAQAIAWAQRGDEPPPLADTEFEQAVDPETWTSPDARSGPPTSCPTIRRPQPEQRRRVRGG